MGRFAEDSVYSNAPSPTTGAGLAILASNQRAILELPGAQAPQLVTISDGAITPTGAFLRVDTEGQAAADDLTIINVTINDTESLHDGMIVYLQAADSGRVVTIKNTASAGGITTYDGQDTTLSTDSWLQLQLQGGNWVEMYNQRTGADVPVGTIIWSANPSAPAGYLLCNGASVGRDTYPELFAAIGTTYGEGDGSTTFNLPDLIGRFIEGSSTAGTVKAAGLPNITGQSALIPLQSSTDVDQKTGAIRTVGSGNSSTGGTGTKTGYIYFDAADSSSVYGNSTTVQPPAVTALPCIKAFSSVVGDATVVAGQLINEIQSKVALDGSNTASIGGTLSTYMAHAAMPSGQYIELALPANGTVLTAPADGYVAFEMRGLTGQYIGLWARNPADISVDYYASCCILAANNVAKAFIPISKGQNYAVGYTATGTFSYLRFIYANGSAPQS